MDVTAVAGRRRDRGVPYAGWTHLRARRVRKHFGDGLRVCRRTGVGTAALMIMLAWFHFCSRWRSVASRVTRLPLSARESAGAFVGALAADSDLVGW